MRGNAIFVYLHGKPIGIIKNEGDRTFLSLVNMRHSRGYYSLIAGAVYNTDSFPIFNHHFGRGFRDPFTPGIYHVDPNQRISLHAVKIPSTTDLQRIEFSQTEHDDFIASLRSAIERNVDSRNPDILENP